MGTKRIAAYAAIYLFWGGSYLAIRQLVEVIPPLLAAGVRYALAGLILILFSACRSRQPVPSLRQTLHAISIGIALLAFSYGTIYWAETRLASWVVAVLASTIFLWTYLGECLVLRISTVRAKMLLPLMAGLGGMPLLAGASFKHGQIGSMLAAIAVVSGALLWAAMTLALKRVELPRSSIQTAALQLVSAGLTLICISRLSGEMSRLPEAREMFTTGPVVAMAYLVIAASVLGFTAFHWLLAHDSPTLVSTSAYVNPIVAMLLGILVIHESWSVPQLLGAAVILGSIVFVWAGQKQSDSQPAASGGGCVSGETVSDSLTAAPAR